MYLLAIWMCSVKICLFSSFAQFCLIFFLLSGIISLYILYVNALCNIWLANVFLPFCRFVHCFVYFAVQEFLGEIV